MCRTRKKGRSITTRGYLVSIHKRNYVRSTIMQYNSITDSPVVIFKLADKTDLPNIYNISRVFGKNVFYLKRWIFKLLSL